MRRFRLTPLRVAAAIAGGIFAFASVGYAASLGIGSSQLHAWSQTLTKGTCNQTSTTEDDTFVQQSNPTQTNGGTNQQLTVGGAANSQNDAFIRFDLSGCNLPTTGGADSATLNLWVTAHSNDTISVFPVYSTWSSTTLNWNGLSGLSIGTTATTTFVASANGAKAVPVTATVDAEIKAGAFWGWELRDTSGTANTKFSSANNTNSSQRPTLTVNDEK